MAVDVNLSNIGSGFNRAVVNNNFDEIQTSLGDALSRSGNGPNNMEADLDMDGHNILNTESISVERLFVDGTEFVADDVSAVGPPGADGDDATVTVGTVTTGAAGSSVIITNVGTANDAIFDFTIPRGDVGASGAGSGDMVAAQNLNDLASKPTAFNNIKQAATTSATGVVELATTTEASAGVDTTRVVTPAGLAQYAADHPSSGSTKTVYDSSVTWNKPSVGNVALIQVWGAGGSGGRATGGGGRGGGGGGGGYNEITVPLDFLPASLSITIGIGGAAKTTNGSGNNGTNTTFGSILTGYGGAGGIGSNNTGQNAGGGGGGNTGAATSETGGTGTDAAHTGGNGLIGAAGGSSTYGGGAGGGGSSSSKGGAGGNSVYAGAGGSGTGDNGVGEGSGAAGVSTYGGNGGVGTNSNTGVSATAGTAPGGGGGGGSNAGDTFSGAGANGRCIVTVY